MTFEHNGRSNFVVESYDADGNRMDLLANVIGKHLGTTLVDALAGEQTSRLAIKADGKWKVIMSNLMEAKRVSTPGEISGTGPDVFIVEPGQVDLIKVSSETNSNVIVYGFSPRGKDLLVNEIGPYTGTVPANRETFLIQVQIEDPWTIEVTSR
jgi:hypothetical protein